VHGRARTLFLTAVFDVSVVRTAIVNVHARVDINRQNLYMLELAEYTHLRTSRYRQNPKLHLAPPVRVVFNRTRVVSRGCRIARGAVGYQLHSRCNTNTSSNIPDARRAAASLDHDAGTRHIHADVNKLKLPAASDRPHSGARARLRLTGTCPAARCPSCGTAPCPWPCGNRPSSPSCAARAAPAVPPPCRWP